jgi:hypothetical protein
MSDVLLSQSPLATRFEHRLQDRGLIRHQSVDTEIEEAIHFIDIIDRPDMYLKATSVSSRDKTLCHQRELSSGRWNLRSERSLRNRSSSSESSRLDWPQTRTHPITEGLANCSKATIAEATNTYPIETITLAKQRDKWLKCFI